ncbi:MAG: 6-bladed beta-propeller, partial [Bacteroidales bacterium]|nr:6-bladed beta-propeller [Bacteroidales bacterium]
MKKKVVAMICLALCLPAIIGASSLDRKPVVAKKITSAKGTLVSCNPKLLKDTIKFPLSELIEGLEVIRLDNADAALVGGYVRPIIGEKYILMSNNKQVPYKLFDRKGKFVAKIGSYGQGPGEYLNTYYDQLDEKNNRIYILPWNARHLLVYDLKGRNYPSIPLAMDIPKGAFYVDAARSLITVTSLPFEGLPAIVFQQDFKGKMIKSVKPAHLAIPRDYSDEVSLGLNTSDYDVSFLRWKRKTDTLFHYNTKANRLEPRFTMDLNLEGSAYLCYTELPHFFLGAFSFMRQISANTSVGTEPAAFVVNKETLKGSYVEYINDFLGGISLGKWTPFFRNGYYIANSDPMDLKEKLDEILIKNKKMDPKVRQRVQALSKSLNENDNNVVLIGRVKR